MFVLEGAKFVITGKKFHYTLTLTAFHAWTMCAGRKAQQKMGLLDVSAV